MSYVDRRMQAPMMLSMEPSLDFCRSTFEEALRACKDLSDEDDFEAMHNVGSYEALRRDLDEKSQKNSNPRIFRFLGGIEKPLQPLRNLFHVFSLAPSSDHVKAGLVWGSISRLIDVSLRSEKISSYLLAALGDLSYSLGLISDHQMAGVPTPFMEGELTDVFATILLFCSQTIHIIRSNPIEKRAIRAWEDKVRQNFEEVIDKINKKAVRIKERPAAGTETGAHPLVHLHSQSRGEMAGYLGSPEPKEKQKQSGPGLERLKPFHSTTLVNNNFFGRGKELQKLRIMLDHQVSNIRHRAAVIWGAGGIGKSQIALAYINERKSAGVRVTLWVDSETTLEINQSFNEIAFGLAPEEAIRGDAGTNIYLVKKLLQATGEQWLLIFDNVENIDLVKDCWPTGLTGSVLMTSRHEIQDLMLESLEIPLFNDVEGKELLLKIIARHFYSVEESNSAESLSSELGGLPLALIVMAMQIRRRQVQIKQFLNLYEESRSDLHKSATANLKPFYKHSLQTAWDMSFASLNEEERTLFSVFCMAAPDAIPLSMLRDSSSQLLLPDGLKFCRKSLALENALDALITTSLIRRDPETDRVFVHRVIQQEFRNKMSKDDQKRKIAFTQLAKLLRNAFPPLVNGVSLRNSWPTCHEHINHILALSRIFEEFEFDGSGTEDFEDFTQVLAPAAWYLHESGTSTECLKLLNIAFKACNNKNSLLYATLLNNAAIVEEKRNRSGVAIDLYADCRRIRESHLPKDHAELANVYNNTAMALMSKRHYEDAEKLLQDALSIDLIKPVEEQNKILHTRYMNLGWLYALMGRWEESREKTQIGRGYVLNRFGDDSYYIATCERYLAYVNLQEGFFDKARKGYERAYSILTTIYKVPVHITISSTTYMLGCVELLDGNFQKSIAWLKKTLEMAQKNVPGRGDSGEVARVSRKLAQAYYEIDNTEDGKRYQQEAEEIRRTLQGEAFKDLPDTDESYDLLVAAQFRT